MNFSRRDFVRTSALAMGGTLLGRGSLLAQGASSASLNVALVGCGNQGAGSDLRALLATGSRIVALCDVDARATAATLKAGGDALAGARIYTDYRQMLAAEKALDAVIVATPDHWHAPLCRAFIQAGKHVYCEKPLTRTIGEARDLAALAAGSRVVTQMGNQGSASASLRKGVEVIQAGVLGRIAEMHVISPGERYPLGVDRPPGADPVPDGFNWDAWTGPAPVRPYKGKVYHPYQWRGWFDFGTGQMGNWGCHILNLPVRALNLGLPTRVEVQGEGMGHESYWTAGTITFRFDSAQGPVAIYWHENQPRPAVFDDVAAIYGEKHVDGLVVVGEKGKIYTDSHNGGELLKLEGEDHYHDIIHHPAVKDLPQTLPRVHSHMEEWVTACKGGGPVYSGFGFGAHLTEIALAGLLAVRLGKGIDYDGTKGEVPGVPEAAALIRAADRPAWL